MESPNVTLMLRQLRSGDASAAARIAEIIYPQLHELARARMGMERPGHVLQRTALVNEAYIRLVAHHDQDWRSRAHFFAAAATTMRRILIDYARRRRPRELVPLDEVGERLAMEERPVDLLALDEALAELEKVSPQQARVVELRYFVGLSIPEIAEVLGRSPRTVNTYWAAARHWLHRRLSA